MKALGNTMRRMAVVSAMAAVLVAACGCDLGLTSLLNTVGTLSNLGGTDLWDTGGWDTGGWDTYPDSTLYDPTATIQSVIDYRQDVYDNVNAGWDEYIMQ
ncbi:MAG: hypothetical protein KA383_02430 [Phycisphaerae bacterium]|nr:hypothetical protein [Phycisphaerae bacterium]